MRRVHTDGAVLIRPLEQADRDALFASVRESIAEVSAWLPWCHSAYMPEESTAFIESTRQAWAQESTFNFGIFDAQTGEHLGGVSVNHIVRQNRMANVGYWVRTGATKRGVAVRAVRLAAQFAFEDLGLTRIEIAAIPENLASRRVAEKVGARLEVIARNRIVMHGQAYPAALYSLVPADLAASRASVDLAAAGESAA
jgi:RimJ/RimL family protein N-acetyltransferase